MGGRVAVSYGLPPAGGGVIGTGYYTDGTISTATTYQIDPSNYRAATGDDSSITYNPSGLGPGLEMDDPTGWYQAYVSITVGGLTAGQVARLTVQANGCIDPHYVFAAKFGTDDVRLTIATGPWQNTSAGNVLTAVLDNPSGGTIVAPSVMALTQVSGPS